MAELFQTTVLEPKQAYFPRFLRKVNSIERKLFKRYLIVQIEGNREFLAPLNH